MRTCKLWPMQHSVFIGFLIVILLYSQEIFAQDETFPGEVRTPYPTIINLSVEWIIQGDDNQNGLVTMQFRKKGADKWEQGMPLFRVPDGENTGFEVGNNIHTEFRC